MIVYDEMIREKVFRLRFGLLVIGCSNAAFWISWVITGIVFSIAMTLMMIISGFAFGFDFFTLTPFYVLFMIIFSSCITYVSMAAALVTVMSN